ncbi:hypothetical protein LINPERHAP2_LOCUS16803, partial [Linum perenne]
VVDSGFTNAPGFLAPFRGYTAHFQDIRRQGGPKDCEENFNYRQSSLRNVIERCFGVLNKRWSILKGMCSYNFDKQTNIVIACCALHNFIRMHAQRDSLFAEFEKCDVQGERVKHCDVHNLTRLRHRCERWLRSVTLLQISCGGLVMLEIN